jgi:hypothetical protein
MQAFRSTNLTLAINFIPGRSGHPLSSRAKELDKRDIDQRFSYMNATTDITMVCGAIYFFIDHYYKAAGITAQDMKRKHSHKKSWHNSSQPWQRRRRIDDRAITQLVHRAADSPTLLAPTQDPARCNHATAFRQDRRLVQSGDPRHCTPGDAARDLQRDAAASLRWAILDTGSRQHTPLAGINHSLALRHS